MLFLDCNICTASITADGFSVTVAMFEVLSTISIKVELTVISQLQNKKTICIYLVIFFTKWYVIKTITGISIPQLMTI